MENCCIVNVRDERPRWLRTWLRISQYCTKSFLWQQEIWNNGTGGWISENNFVIRGSVKRGDLWKWCFVDWKETSPESVSNVGILYRSCKGQSLWEWSRFICRILTYNGKLLHCECPWWEAEMTKDLFAVQCARRCDWGYQGLSVWRVGAVGLRRFNLFGRRLIDPRQKTKTIGWMGSWGMGGWGDDGQNDIIQITVDHYTRVISKREFSVFCFMQCWNELFCNRKSWNVCCSLIFTHDDT